jgi:peptide deformylase
VIFNPRIVDHSDKLISMKEGCLSFPLLYLNVKRPDRIRIRYQYHDGETTTQQFIGMTARIVLHEYDHMEGKVFTQKASSFEKERALRKRMILKRKVSKVANGKR